MNQGFAALITIFVIGLCAILVGSSLTLISYQDSLMSRAEVDSTQAFYAAQAGIEEAFAQILRNSSLYGNPGPSGYQFSVGSAGVAFSVTGNDTERTIVSTGTFDNHVRRITVVTKIHVVHPGFLQAVHAGQGGFEMRHNTVHHWEKLYHRQCLFQQFC
jgi:Tfp pilus assembly protein PilX